MRELHVVAMSEDGRHVVLATRKGTTRGEFKVALDDRLAAAMRGELPRPGERSARDIVLSPKEIQARLRAGESTEQIAASAGVPVARVERYAGPVLSEREKVINGARAAVLARSRRGLSSLPMGEAVAQHLSQAAGYKPESTRWSARREPSGRWVVALSYVARAQTRTAAWRFDPGTREITALDAASTALAHVDPTLGQRAAANERLPPPKELRAPRRATGRAATATTAGKPSSRPAAVTLKASVKAPSVKAPSVKPAVKAASVKAASGKAPAAKVPSVQPPSITGTGKRAVASGRLLPGRTIAAPGAQVSGAHTPHPAGAAPSRPAPTAPDTAAAETTPAETTPAETTPAETTPAETTPAPAPAETTPAPAPAAPPTPAASAAPSGPPTLRVVPHPAPAEQEPAASAEPEAGAGDPPPSPPPPPPARRAAGARASVPAWADVLLGIAPVDRPGGADKDRD